MDKEDDLYKIYVKYKILYDRYLIEWQRATGIQSKAICIIGFVGVLFVFSANLSLNSNKITNNYYILDCYKLCIFLLIITFYTGMRTLFYGNSKMRVLSMDYIMSGSNPKNIELIRIICEELRDITGYNNKLNNTKNDLLKITVKLFIISGIILCILTLLSIGVQPASEAGNTTNHSDNISMNNEIQVPISKNTSNQNPNISRPVSPPMHKKSPSNLQHNKGTTNNSISYDLLYKGNLNLYGNKVMVNNSW